MQGYHLAALIRASMLMFAQVLDTFPEQMQMTMASMGTTTDKMACIGMLLVQAVYSSKKWLSDAGCQLTSVMTTISDKSRRAFRVGLREPLDSTQLLQVIHQNGSH